MTIFIIWFLQLHRVKVQFGADLFLSYYLYTKMDFDWRALDWYLFIDLYSLVS